MAFKNFSAFSSAMDSLQRQLDINSLFVRVINRVSNLITSAQGIPSQYTNKYNQVQLLQYDADGQLQDVTPGSQLTIPNSVLLEHVASIKSSQRLIESDLAVVDEAASQPLKVSTAFKQIVGITDSDIVPICFPTHFGLLDKSTGFINNIITTETNFAHVTFIPGEVECRMTNKDGVTYPIHYTLDGCSWCDNDLSCVYLTPKPGAGGGNGNIIIRVVDDLSHIDTQWRDVGMIIGVYPNNFVLPGGHLQMRLMDGKAEHKGFVSSNTSLVTFETKDPSILFGLRSFVNHNPQYPLLESSNGTGLLGDIFYPKSAIDELTASLEP